MLNAYLTNSAGKRFELTGSSILGRSPECTVALAGRQVSGQHCLIVRLSSGCDLLVDLNSTEGTQLNHARMLLPTLLEGGDVIQVGRHVLAYDSESAESTITALAALAAAAPVATQLNGTGVIAFSLDGLTIPWASERAKTWLPIYFPLEPDRQVPRSITDWLAKIVHQTNPETLRRSQGVRQLVLHLIECAESHNLVVVTEEEVFDAAGIARQLHLSRREGEVLYWVAAGNDRESVGRILFISKRTVDKHCENMFIKLGVTDRAAAVRLVVALPGFAVP